MSEEEPQNCRPSRDWITDCISCCKSHPILAYHRRRVNKPSIGKYEPEFGIQTVDCAFFFFKREIKYAKRKFGQKRGNEQAKCGRSRNGAWSRDRTFGELRSSYTQDSSRDFHRKTSKDLKRETYSEKLFGRCLRSRAYAGLTIRGFGTVQFGTESVGIAYYAITIRQKAKKNAFHFK